MPNIIQNHNDPEHLEETLALLPEPSSSSSSSSPGSTERAGFTQPARTFSGRSPGGIRSIVLTLLSSASVVFLLDIGNSLSLAPQTAVLESIVCEQYYARGRGGSPSLSTVIGDRPPSPPDHAADLCKLPAIQAEVAFINGWKDVSETLPGILLAVFYGVLADRLRRNGRKKVLLMAVAGLVMSDLWVRIVYSFPNLIPLRAVWLVGAFQVLGAGGATLSSMVFAQLADACPAEQRTAAFSILASAALLNQLVFVPVGAALMRIDPWVPMWLTSALGVLGFVVGWLFVPGTGPRRNFEDNAGEEEEWEDEEEEGGGLGGALGGKKGVWAQMRELGGTGREVITALAENKNATLVLFASLCFSLAIMSDSSLLLQYASKRLGWTIGEASILLSVRAGVGLLVLAVLLPLLSSFFLVRLNLHESLKDKRVAQASGVFLVLGAGTIFLASWWLPLFVGQVVFAVGFAYTATTRSMLTATIDPDQLGTAFTALSVFTQAGFLAGSPLLATAFGWGMKLGDFWSGMPFLVAACVSVIGTMAISAASVRRDIII